MYQDGLIVHVFVLYATFTGLHVCVNSDEGNGAEIIAASTATPLSVIIVILAALVVRDYLRRRRERQYRRQQLRNRLNMQQVHNRLAAPAGGQNASDDNEDQRLAAPAGGQNPNDDEDQLDGSFDSFDEDLTAVKGKSYETVLFGPAPSAPTASTSAASASAASPPTASAFRPPQASTPAYANVELHAPPTTRASTPLSASHSRASTPHYENVELRPMPTAATLIAEMCDQAAELDTTETVDLSSEVETTQL